MRFVLIIPLIPILLFACSNLRDSDAGGEVATLQQDSGAGSDVLSKGGKSFKTCLEIYKREAQVCEELYTSPSEETDDGGPQICLQAVGQRFSSCAPASSPAGLPSAHHSPYEAANFENCAEVFQKNWQICEDVFGAGDNAGKEGLQICHKATEDKLIACNSVEANQSPK